MPDEIKTLIAVVGPTAIGKTALGITLARHYQTEILSADSRQFYKEMSIGTAKPDLTELQSAKHHFINSHSIHENFNVADFESAALHVLDELFKTRNIAVVVGGSGLYIKALCDGLDKLPDVDPAIRMRLNEDYQQKGISYLQDRLKKADPVYYKQADLNNPHRMIRALEVFEGTGIAFSKFHQKLKKERPFNIIKIGLNMPRALLYERINQRVDQMLEKGLLEEVQNLVPYQHLNALNTVGYTEIFDFIAGKTTYETAVNLLKQNTRRFAKRQLTWFRKDMDIHWLEPEQTQQIIKTIDSV
jgi:tRNA dimethylallyltransferase